MYMKYNRFFNIHIPKTGGTFFRENILKQLELEMNKNGIETNPPSCGGENDSQLTKTFHLCWYKPFITENTYIYTSFRNPAKRIISHYAWQAVRAIHYKKTNYTYSDINKNNFYKWIDQYYQVHKNFQSKNILYYNKNHDIYKESIHLGWKDGGVPTVDSFMFSDEFVFDVNHLELYNNIKKINLFIKSENLNNIDYQKKIINKISEDLLLNTNINFIPNEKNNKNEISNELFSEFSKKEIEKLYLHSSIDSEIFFSTVYTDI